MLSFFVEAAVTAARRFMQAAGGMPPPQHQFILHASQKFFLENVFASAARA